MQTLNLAGEWKLTRIKTRETVPAQVPGDTHSALLAAGKTQDPYWGTNELDQQWIGRELVLLAEGESVETPLLWEGRTQFHAPEIDGKVYINDFGNLEMLEPGRFYNAVITEAHEYDVVARVVSGPL